VLINLLSNAVKFTSEGRVVVHVSATAGLQSSTVRVEVRDTGIGIDEATLAACSNRSHRPIARPPANMVGPGSG
jgi:signal transduction histidine kinase